MNEYHPELDTGTQLNVPIPKVIDCKYMGRIEMSISDDQRLSIQFVPRPIHYGLEYDADIKKVFMAGVIVIPHNGRDLRNVRHDLDHQVREWAMDLINSGGRGEDLKTMLNSYINERGYLKPKQDSES